MLCRHVLVASLIAFVPERAGAQDAPIAEITAAIEKLVDSPACIKGTSFSTFPIRLNKSLFDAPPRIDEQGKFDVLVEAGLLMKTGDLTYGLAPQGRNAQKTGGRFCFANGFSVSNVTASEPPSSAHMRSDIEAVWLVAFTAEPRQVQEWAHSPAFAKAGLVAGQIKTYANPSMQKIAAFRQKGDKAIQLDNAMFSFRPEISW